MTLPLALIGATVIVEAAAFDVLSAIPGWVQFAAAFAYLISRLVSHAFEGLDLIGRDVEA